MHAPLSHAYGHVKSSVAGNDNTEGACKSSLQADRVALSVCLHLAICVACTWSLPTDPLRGPLSMPQSS